MDWERYFKPHILERGFNYYCDDTVRLIRADNNIITAVVHGTDDYDVEITVYDDNDYDMDCTCPYADDGNYCKHMAAVLYQHYNDDVIDENQQNEKVSESAKELVSEASEDIVRKFLIQLLNGDEKLFARFKSFSSPEVSSADMRKFKNQIDKTMQKYLGRKGFIDYYSAGAFISEIEDFLIEDVQMMLDNEFYMEAFELVNLIFISVGNVDMDDSDGGTGILVNHCYEIWQDIIDTVEIDDKRGIFSWFLNHLDGSVIDYMENYIEQILFESFHEEEFMLAKMVFINEKISMVEKLDDSWSRNYHSGRWAINYITIMESTGHSRDDVEKYCKEHWGSPDVRKHYITRCLEYNEHDKAIDALQESIQMDSGFKGLVSEHSRELKDIFRVCGKKEQYLDQLWQLVTEHSPGNIELFRELKSLYEETEWKVIRERVFSALPPYSNIDKLFREEGLHERLLVYVTQSFGLNALKTHEDILKERYPKEILQKYKDEVDSMASRSSSRSRYRDLVSILRSMKKISGGKKVVNDISLHWQMMYSNRPAMMDELRKL